MTPDDVPRERGCGLRSEGALYCVVPTSPYGRPLSDFLIDPALPWGRRGALRAPLLMPQQQTRRTDNRGNVVNVVNASTSVLDAYMTVGAKNYPSVSDFIEEAETMGVSKRFPRDFDVRALTPGRSRLVLVHSRAIVTSGYEVNQPCPKGLHINHHFSSFPQLATYQQCLGVTWPLGAYLPSTEKHHVEDVTSDGYVTIRTPSVSYTVQEPISPMSDEVSPTYAYGVFLALPISHFEFVNKDGVAPEELLNRFEGTGWRLEVMDR